MNVSTDHDIDVLILFASKKEKACVIYNKMVNNVNDTQTMTLT